MRSWTDGAELYHYGIKGQKWGIRRYQNPDGSYTNEGRIRKRFGKQEEYSRDSKRANEIYRTLNDVDKMRVSGSSNIDPEYQNDTDYASAIYSSIMSYMDVPVSFFDIYKDSNGRGQIAIAVRNDPKYRGKGLAKDAVKKGLNWFEQNADILELEWSTFYDNAASNKLAIDMGFTRIDSSDPNFNVYRKSKEK